MTPVRKPPLERKVATAPKQTKGAGDKQTASEPKKPPGSKQKPSKGDAVTISAADLKRLQRARGASKPSVQASDDELEDLPLEQTFSRRRPMNQKTPLSSEEDEEEGEGKNEKHPEPGDAPTQETSAGENDDGDEDIDEQEGDSQEENPVDEGSEEEEEVASGDEILEVQSARRPKK